MSERRRGGGVGRATGAVSVVLSLALMGDALLYAILPLHAAAFGVSLAWVGVLLSANRFVRLAAYGWIAHLAAAHGLARLTTVGALVGAGSTLLFAFASGGPALLAARIAWGLAYAALAVTVLAYATHHPTGAGARVGWTFSIRQLGPLLALTVGVWLASVFGPREAMLAMGLISLLAVPIAWRLPNYRADAQVEAFASRWWTGRPSRVDLLQAAVALAANGVFVASIGLLLEPRVGTGGATIGAGLVLAGKGVVGLVLSPVGGAIGDRLGLRATVGAMLVLLIGSMASLAAGWLIPGIALTLLGAPVLAALLPAMAAADQPHRRIARLASLNTWRDVGSAVGPLLALAALQWTGPAVLFTAMTLVLALSASTLLPQREREVALVSAGEMERPVVERE